MLKARTGRGPGVADAGDGVDNNPQGGRPAGWWRCLVDSLWLLLASALVALAAGALAPAMAATDAGALYHNYCSVCHGDKGDGRSRAAGALSTMPRDFTTAASKRDLSVERIAAAIAHGRPGTAMVGWKTQLSEADIARLAEHVHSRFVLGQAQAGSAAISGTKAHGGREADANGEVGFMGPMRVVTNPTMGNYYLSNIFGEGNLTEAEVDALLMGNTANQEAGKDRPQS